MTIPFGAIVLTDFPFTDLSAAKRRPALVVSTTTTAAATIDKSIIAGRLGTADPEWLADGRAAFFAVFGFGSR